MGTPYLGRESHGKSGWEAQLQAVAPPSRRGYNLSLALLAGLFVSWAHRVVVLLIGLWLAVPALARPVSVVASLETFSWLTRQIGGDEVRTTTLLPPGASPHRGGVWDPSWQKPLGEGSLLVLAGGGLELAWLGDAVNRSRNSRIRTGKPGYLPLSNAVSSLGNQGSEALAFSLQNPHFWTSPQAMVEAGAAVTRALVGLNAGSSVLFLKNQDAFQTKMNRLSAQSKRQLASLVGRGVKFMDHHGEFAYLFAHYGLTYEGALSENALIPPTSAQIRSRAAFAQSRGVQLLLAASSVDAKSLQGFQTASGIRVIQVPISIAPPFSDYHALHQHWVEQLILGSGGIAE